MTMTAPPFDLSALLRTRTATAHDQAEHAPFLLALAQGRATRAGLVGLLQRLLPVYDALETTAERFRDDRDVEPLLVPGLERADRLRADLDALGAVAMTTSAASTAYAARVRAAAEDAPRYVGHHYTRYLGDLSGGQVVGRAVEQSLGLRLAFFSFDLRGPAVKRDYRAHLDSIAWSPEEAERATDEAGVAFRLNTALAAELEGEVA